MIHSKCVPSVVMGAFHGDNLTEIHPVFGPARIVCSLPRCVNHAFQESLHMGRISPDEDPKSMEME